MAGRARRPLCMLAVLAVFLLAIPLFAACGAEGRQLNGGYGYENDYETPDTEAALTPTPVPLPLPEPIPAPPPEPMPELPEGTFIYGDGVLGVRFSVEIPGDWDFWTFGRGGSGEFVSHDFMGATDFDALFEIGESTGHPTRWMENFGDEFIEAGRNFWPRMNWRHPGEASDVFVTGSGLTVVQYTHSYEAWAWWLQDYTEYITVMYFFRSDGRDYREIPGTQIFYYVMLDIRADRVDEIYGQVREVVESIQFLDGAAISLEPSEAARSIGITQTNYPRIDGSTSTIPIMQQLFMAMFEPSYRIGLRISDWAPYAPRASSRTIPSYELLIANYVDLIFVPNPSAMVLQLAEDAGVELEFIPIAMEALVFITHVENPVSDITREQILQIYSAMGITDWAQLGGYDGRIIAFNRNPHSGSQTLMDNLVLEGHSVHPGLEGYQIGAMDDMLGSVGSAPVQWWFYGEYGQEVNPHAFGLGYTVYFYLRQAQADGWWNVENIKPLALDGVFPTPETIASGEYPLSTNYFAVIRADTPAGAPARLLAEWLATPAGQEAIKAAGLGGL